MPKSLIANRINGTTKTIAVPATPVLAEAFATAFLDGEYAVYKSVSKTGSDIVATAPTKLNVKFWNDANPKDCGYANFVIPATKTENDLFLAMVGLTLNGILIDQVQSITQRVIDKF
jgi:hypothetical protein